MCNRGNQTCPSCRAPHFCYGAKLKIELVKLHYKYENKYKIEYKLTDEELNELNGLDSQSYLERERLK